MTCFVIIPYTDRFLRVYETAIRPAAKECDLECVIAKNQPSVVPVYEEIRELIRSSRLCIADVTGGNPNVMYEVALAHSFDRPVVFITQGEVTEIPFDIRQYRMLPYKSTPRGLRKLEAELIETIQLIFKDGGSRIKGLREMLDPSSLSQKGIPYVVAASPLSYRSAFKSHGGWVERPMGTYSDHVGIRGLMQAFGLIYGLDRLPELVDPDDFNDRVLRSPMHLYCVASPKANRWTGLMLKEFFENRSPKWEFRPDSASSEIRNPKVVVYMGGKRYEPVNREEGGRLIWDFGLIIRGPHPYDSGRLLLAMAGRSSLGTEAACLAATHPDCVGKLDLALRDKGVSLDNHNQAFCAVVSVRAKESKAYLGADKDQFNVEDLRTY